MDSATRSHLCLPPWGSSQVPQVCALPEREQSQRLNFAVWDLKFQQRTSEGLYKFRKPSRTRGTGNRAGIFCWQLC